MVTCKQEDGVQADSRQGAAAAPLQRSHGEKQKDADKLPKNPKALGKDPPRDMFYYAQKVTEAGEQPLEEDLKATPAICHTDQEGKQSTQGPLFPMTSLSLTWKRERGKMMLINPLWLKYLGLFTRALLLLIHPWNTLGD